MGRQTIKDGLDVTTGHIIVVGKQIEQCDEIQLCKKKYEKDYVQLYFGSIKTALRFVFIYLYRYVIVHIARMSNCHCFTFKSSKQRTTFESNKAIAKKCVCVFVDGQGGLGGSLWLGTLLGQV